MKLLYPETKFEGFQGKVVEIEWLFKVRNYLISLNKEVVPITIEGEIARETGITETDVNMAMKCFGELFARKGKKEITGKDFDRVFVEMAKGKTTEYKNWDVYWRIA